MVADDPTFSTVLEDAQRAKNPKDLIGSTKVPLHLWPATATAFGAIGLLDGAMKYGRHNWRGAPVVASIYVDALKRHIDSWFEGEERASDTNVYHFCYMLANLAILADAWVTGTLIDDRMVRGSYPQLLAHLTPEVMRLKQLHAGKNPHHYQISDNDDPQLITVVSPIGAK